MISRAFVERITADLRAFAAVLLEAGLAPTAPGTAQPGSISLAYLEATLAAFAALFDRLLEEAAAGNRLSRRAVRRTTPVPRRAAASRRPWHRQLHEGRVLPTLWVMADPTPAPDPEALAYLAYLLETLGAQLDRVGTRLGKHLEDAWAARGDGSPFAVAERDRLEAMAGRLRAAVATRGRLRRRLRTRAGGRTGVRSLPPRPAIPGPAWRALRALAPRILAPATALPAWLGAALDPAAEAPDLAFLYQRWCGLKVLEALHALGFRVRGDAVGPLFLGEQAIRLADENGVPITLWCEPRLVRGRAHGSGLQPIERREQQPDFVLLAPGERGLEAYVLDATLATEPARLAEKGAYRHTLVFDGMRTVAGVPVPKRPLRSWAVAPVLADVCRLHDPEGRTGTVPLAPERGPDALAAFLEDVTRSARAWWRGP